MEALERASICPARPHASLNNSIELFNRHDALVQNRASGGACCSTSDQRADLKARFSGPHSWTMALSLTAAGTEEVSLTCGTHMWRLCGRIAGRDLRT